jgi:hypothetical protein
LARSKRRSERCSRCAARAALDLMRAANRKPGTSCPSRHSNCPRSTLLLKMIDVVVFSTPSTLPI